MVAFNNPLAKVHSLRSGKSPLMSFSIAICLPDGMVVVTYGYHGPYAPCMEYVSAFTPKLILKCR